MTAKQAARAYERIARALEEVEANIQQMLRESSDSERGDYDFDPPSRMETDITEWAQEMYNEAKSIREQEYAKEAE